MRAVDAPKKRMNKFVFFAVKSKKAKKKKIVGSFFGRIYGASICLRFYLTFRISEIYLAHHINHESWFYEIFSCNFLRFLGNGFLRKIAFEIYWPLKPWKIKKGSQLIQIQKNTTIFSASQHEFSPCFVRALAW